MINFNYFTEVLTAKYAQFTGRARRAEYWNYVLFYIIFDIIIELIAGAIGFSKLGAIFGLAMLVPTIAVAVRRMHDTNHSGWFVLIPFYNLYLCCIEGDASSNQYGDNPKG